MPSPFMTPFQASIHWFVIAAVFTIGYYAQWGQMARLMIKVQADFEDRSPLHVVADTYVFFLIMTTPLAVIYDVVSAR